MALPRPSAGTRLLVLAATPLVLAAAVIAALVAVQSERTAEREIAALEATILEAKRAELRNYVELAKRAFVTIYGNAAPDQSRQTWLIGRDWSGLADAGGDPVTDRLIALAREGSGYHAYLWRKPSTGEEGRFLAYVTGLQDWRWALGTGVFVDDVLARVADARGELRDRVRRTFLTIGLVTGVALLGVFLSGLMLTTRERRLADTKLKALTQRVLDTQEEERGRVARELHDGISQILVGVRYKLDLARRLAARGDARAGAAVEGAAEGLQGAIGEVRRISHDLRPGVLDDLGLGPALRDLCLAFEARTGLPVAFETVVFRNRLDLEAKTALYRIAQEALTNVERHAGASRVEVRLFGHRRGGTLRIADDGVGLGARSRGGLGLRNMAERIEQLGGTLEMRAGPGGRGTVIEATVPLSHLLTPETEAPVAHAAE